jgi:hypothetical protein
VVANSSSTAPSGVTGLSRKPGPPARPRRSEDTWPVAQLAAVGRARRTEKYSRHRRRGGSPGPRHGPEAVVRAGYGVTSARLKRLHGRAPDRCWRHGWPLQRRGECCASGQRVDGPKRPLSQQRVAAEAKEFGLLPATKSSVVRWAIRSRFRPRAWSKSNSSMGGIGYRLVTRPDPLIVAPSPTLASGPVKVGAEEHSAAYRTRVHRIVDAAQPDLAVLRLQRVLPAGGWRQPAAGRASLSSAAIRFAGAQPKDLSGGDWRAAATPPTGC